MSENGRRKMLHCPTAEMTSFCRLCYLKARKTLQLVKPQASQLLAIRLYQVQRTEHYYLRWRRHSDSKVSPLKAMINDGWVSQHCLRQKISVKSKCKKCCEKKTLGVLHVLQPVGCTVYNLGWLLFNTLPQEQHYFVNKFFYLSNFTTGVVFMIAFA